MRILLSLLLICSCGPAADAPVARLDVGAAAPAALLADPASISPLGGAPLDGTALATTDRGRVALTLLVACALGPDDVLVAGGVEFFGGLGLAPAWTTRALRSAERELVTGCALAHLSLDGLPVVVSLRAYDALTADRDERTAYPVAEGRFYGDILQPGPRAIACRGAGAILQPAASGLAHRRCATPDPARPGLTLCGLIAGGDCAAACGYRSCALGGTELRSVAAFVVE